jgi:hypothetical protein
MEAIKKLLSEIHAVDPDEIRERLSALDAESKELRKILRVRLSNGQSTNRVKPSEKESAR